MKNYHNLFRLHSTVCAMPNQLFIAKKQKNIEYNDLRARSCDTIHLTFTSQFVSKFFNLNVALSTKLQLSRS